MHDELHRSRKLAFDEKVIDERRATVADRSAVLQRILGYAKVNGPFTAPPPLPAADTVSASTVLMPTVSSGHAVSKDLQPLSSVAARMKWSPTIDVVAQRNVKSQPSLGRQEATMQIAQPISNSSLPHQSTDSQKKPKLQSSPKKHLDRKAPVEPARRKYHPDLLGFTFPAAPAPEDKKDQKMNDAMSYGGFTGQDSPAAGRKVLGNAFTPEPFAPPSAQSSEFDIYRDAESTSTEDAPQFNNNTNVHNKVLHDMSSKRTITGNTLQNSSQFQSTPQPPRQPPTQCNVVPNLGYLFDQWFRFGRKHWEGLCLLQPREIPIHSVTARTIPCPPRTSPYEIVEKPAKLFTIADQHDAAEVKMIEVEVLPESDNMRKALLNSHHPYHETSTANPNIWTILYIQEKPSRFPENSAKGPEKLGKGDTGVVGTPVAKRRRGTQVQGVEEPVLGEETVQTSWQLVAWPSAHVSRFMEVLGPVREKDLSDEQTENRAQGSSAGRTPLAPKIVQVRQQPSLGKPQSGRVHLKDARAYAEYMATAQARAEKQQNASDGAPQVVADRERIPFPLQPPFYFKVDAVAGRVQQLQQLSGSMSSLSIGNKSDENVVLVHEMQRLTCLRFQRGGAHPLLAGNDVDLNYWNTFCEYFAKGEVQLEVLSPVDGEPVILSEREQQLRRGTGARNVSTWGEELDARHSAGTSKGRLDALRSGGRTWGTPIPESMKSAIKDEREDEPDSTPLLQRQHTPYGAQNGFQQRGTRNAYQFISKARNTTRHQSLYQLPSLSKPMDHLQHTRVSSFPKASSTTCTKQHSDRQDGSSVETIKAKPIIDVTNKTPVAQPKFVGAAAERTGPLMKGWQMEMLDALGKGQNPVWQGWTERSATYQEREKEIEHGEKRIAQEAFSHWSKEVQVQDEDRSCRDDNTMFQSYAAETKRRHEDMVRLQAAKPLREKLDDNEDMLRGREAMYQSRKHMDEVRLEAIRRECNRGRMSPKTGMRILEKSLRVGQQQKQEENQQRQHQQQQEYQQRQYQQQPVHPVNQGALGSLDQAYRFQHLHQPPYVPGVLARPIPQTVPYGMHQQQYHNHPQHQQQVPFGYGFANPYADAQRRAQHLLGMNQAAYPYGQHVPQAYGQVQQPYAQAQQQPFHSHLQQIGRHFNQQMAAPPPALQQPAPGAPGVPSYFVWQQVSGALAAEQQRASYSNAMEYEEADEDDDEDDDDDEHEGGYY
ncbi:hypothetical protein DBV05_g2419 [Lasiodiplodia theobromae]|uniref:Uncharacterized protein n=1 Tax=Lasiodiplodia theobromae TaxID=45133 RepID=A0A5N5DNZ5_9PEZI|nr:hypothetical protein DBV05_g2419 [Lasiodiplodia theobromae]